MSKKCLFILCTFCSWYFNKVCTGISLNTNLLFLFLTKNKPKSKMEDEQSRRYITNHCILIIVEPLIQVVTQNVKPRWLLTGGVHLQVRVTTLGKNFASSPNGNCSKCFIQM